MTEEEKIKEAYFEGYRDAAEECYLVNNSKTIIPDSEDMARGWDNSDSKNYLFTIQSRVKELEQAVEKAIDNINCDASEAAIRPLIELMEGK